MGRVHHRMMKDVYVTKEGVFWMKQKVVLFCLCCAMLCGCIRREKEQKTQVTEPIQNTIDIAEGRIGDDMPVTRAMAAKMIALAFYSQEEIKNVAPKENFNDISQEEWYAPYVYSAVNLGFMQGDGEGFHPEEPITLYQAQVLMEGLNPDSKERIKLTDDTKDKPVAYSLWMEVFINALKGRRAEDSLYSYGILAKELVVLKEENEKNKWLTTQGILHTEGYDFSKYVGKKLIALVKNGEVAGLMELMQNNPLIENVGYRWDENGIEVDAGYGKALFVYEGEEPKQAEGLGDIQLQKGAVVQVFPAEKMEKDIIKKADEKEVHLGNLGCMQWQENFKVYEEKEDGLHNRSISRLICGTDIADFYRKDGKLCAAVIRRKTEPQKIRVLLSNTGFKGYLHEKVEITANEDCNVLYGKQKKVIPKGEPLLLTLQEDLGLFENKRITLECKKNGVFSLNSVSKGGANPRYQGTLEIEKKENGFIIINELPFEEYIKGVVPGEMPVSFGLEALKVQAVAARSYGYNQYFANAYGRYGAHVDDSTGCQVYNGYTEAPLAEQAVEETKGMCLVYGNKIVNANFYSTSAGVTANSGEVWASNGGKQFPSANREYLISQNQGIEKDLGDLSNEESVSAFLKDWTSEGYDANSPWYRWKVTFPIAQWNEIILSGLKEVKKGNANLVQVLQKDGSWKSGGSVEIGAIKSTSVSKRGQGGNAMILEIQGEKQTVRVLTELAIRKTLRPAKQGEGEDIIIQCFDGSIRQNMNLLPSGFFIIEEKKDENGNVKEVTLHGGGNGHGVGMSQYGAKGMAERGYTYDKILEHYFHNAKVYQVIGKK